MPSRANRRNMKLMKKILVGERDFPEKKTSPERNYQ